MNLIKDMIHGHNTDGVNELSDTSSGSGVGCINVAPQKGSTMRPGSTGMRAEVTDVRER